ncbi:O-methyltransferase [Acinetobacter wanghuae]|uniref:O-methyltransferase n=1 Tax=Acinetobacter wanghuae TaxID=2662362 RepID=UPI003AF996EF
MQDMINFECYIHDLYLQFCEHDATHSDRLKRYRNIEPESAQFLSILVKAQQSKQLLEIGTSTGYSTLWLAEALSKTQGKMITLEIDAARSEQAQRYAKDLNLGGIVDYRVIDAFDFLQQNQEVFDFILLDAERDAYVDYWQHLARLINPKGGLLVVDNVLSHAEQVQDFMNLVNHDGRFVSSTISVGAGLCLIGYR